MKPTRSILSREFKYVTADHTDLRLTFKRIRQEWTEQANAAIAKRAEDERRWIGGERAHLELEPPANVTELRKTK